jgi:hypothetical protein
MGSASDLHNAQMLQCVEAVRRSRDLLAETEPLVRRYAASSDEPEGRRGLTLRGYEMTVRAGPDDVRITCSELPQLGVRDATLSGALCLAEDAIDAILGGDPAEPGGAA